MNTPELPEAIPMMSFDLAVIGAGPAGTSAAITAAQHGQRVILIERCQFPRHQVGETLHPGVEPLLRQLGVWDDVVKQDFIRHRSVTFQFHGQATISAYGDDSNGPWLGLQAWRETFDDILLKKCQDLGVCTWQPCGVFDSIVRDGQVVGIRTDRGAIHAETIVDAAGSQHWLARQLKLSVPAISPRLIARYGYVTGNFAPAFDTPLFVADSHGWTWIARVRQQTYQWTRLSLWNVENCDTTGQHDYLPEELQGLQAHGRTRGADVTWRCASHPGGKDYFLCGDAAAVLDPAASHGVLKALMSGIYAGTLAGKIARGIKSREECAAEYSSWVHSLFEHDVMVLKSHYSKMGLCGLYY